MHPIQTSRNRVPRIEVVSNSAAHVHGKRKILSLRPDDAQRFLCVNIPEPQASIKVGCQSPMARYKIASNTHDPRDVGGFRPLGITVKAALAVRSQLPRKIQGPPTSSICQRREAM